MKNRIWATILILMLLIALVPAAVTAYDPIGDGVLPPPESYDIFINVDENFGMKAEDFEVLLRQKLLELQGQPNGVGGTYNPITDADIKTSANVTTIDTTNLDGWYVYDNYNYEPGGSVVPGTSSGITNGKAGYWANTNNLPTDDLGIPLSKEAAWEKNYKTSTDNYMRPAFFIQDTWAYASRYDTIEQIVVDQATIDANWNTSHRLKEHIYSYIDDAGKPGMWFFGYGTWSIADFLFYPTTSKGSKNVKFTVDSSYVYTHALNGAGFLFNTGIDGEGKIHGYVAYYKFSSASAVSRLSIYRIKDDVLASVFHNGTTIPGAQPGTNPGGTNMTTHDRIKYFCDEIAYVLNPTWNAKMSIDATMTPTSLVIHQAKLGDSLDDAVEFTLTEHTYRGVDDINLNGTKTESVPLMEAAYHGFGPLVQYTGSGHSCSLGSAFKFCDLEMSFHDATSKENTVLDALTNTDFIKDSEKYFINLLSLDSDPNLSTSDWEAMARLRENEIYYVTNVENPYLNDGGYETSGTPAGNNGFSALDSILGLTKADGAAYYEKLAEEIAKYILSSKQWDSALPPLETPTPVSMFYLMAKNPNPLNPVEVQVYDVVKNFIGSSGVQIYTEDHSSGGYKDGKPIKVVLREYLITYPDNSTETVKVTGADLNSAKDNLFILKDDCALGLYTVTLTVTNAEDNVSAPVTLKFTVGADAFPPEITWVTPADNTLLFETPDTDVKVVLSDTEYGVAAYSIGYKYPGDTDPIYGTAVYVASYPNYKDFHDLTIDIPIGVYELWLQVWDGAGRLTVESLSVDNRYDISQAAVTVGGETLGGIYYPSTTVVYNGKTLRHGVDYTLSYQHLSAQMWNAVVTGIGDYKNAKTEGFVNPTSSGLFIINVHAVGSGAPTGLSGKAYASILSDADLTLLMSGHNVEVDIYVERVEESMVRQDHFADWAAIWSTFGNNSRTNVWLDITAFVTITSYPQKQVFEFNDDIQITMDLPENKLPSEKQKVMLSYTHILSDTEERLTGKIFDSDSEVTTGTFDIRYFSFFSLSYKKSSNTTGVAQTNDSFSLAVPVIGFITSSTAIVATTSVRLKKKRRLNDTN